MNSHRCTVGSIKESSEGMPDFVLPARVAAKEESFAMITTAALSNLSHIAMILGVGFCHLANALECRPTMQERAEISAIQALQDHPIWREFPANYHFAVREFETSSRGFLVVQPGERNAIVSAKIAEICNSNAGLLQFSSKLSIVQPGFFAGCGPHKLTEGCRTIPQLLDIYQVTKKANGTVGLTRELRERAGRLFPYGLPYTHLQMNVYHAMHEMFHEFQTDHRYVPNDNVRLFQHCVAQNPSWSRSYQREREWWSSALSTIHTARKDKARLRRILHQFYEAIRPIDKLYPDCQQAQAENERTEGVAHFVGSLALLRAGLADEATLARIDKRYFYVPLSKHNEVWTYVTGGGLSWLLFYLLGDEFITRIEQGLTPYEIGKGL